MDSNTQNFLVEQKCRVPGLHLSRSEFLVDNSSCSNDKSLTNAIVMMVPYFFNQTPPSNSSRSKTWHTHTYGNNFDDGHRASARAVLVVLTTLFHG